MAHFTGTFSTNNSAGVREITGLPFLPTYARFTLSQKTSTSEPFIHLSQGFTDATNQGCHSLFWDASGGKSARFSDRVINHINRVSGNLTDAVTANFVSFVDNGNGDYRLKLNFSATITGYRVDMELFG